MTGDPRWVSRHAALAIHALLIAEHGGLRGVRHALPDSAVDNPRNKHAYGETDLFALASADASAVTRNHPFTDGNKRVALTLAGVFLQLKGQRLEASEQEALEAMLALTDGRMSEAEFALWLRSNARPVDAPG